MSSKKPLFAALAAAALCSTALTPLHAFADAPVAFAKGRIQPEPVDPTKPVDFAQNHSDILPDPAVRFGRLANGMTYMILKNAAPPGKASIRFRIGAGSLNESDEQQGLAHFMEHMAFNGSKNVPEGEMVKILERHGLAFGADTNAFTTFGETVYSLEIPKVDDATIDTSLFLMRETAGNLALDPGAIDRERGVILGEERLRNTPSTAASKVFLKDLFDGQRFPNRIPIGQVPIIKNAQRPLFADFYGAWYRPELATLIIVGDIDPDAIEAKIHADFDNWQATVPGPIRQNDYGTYKAKELRADTFTGEGIGNAMTITWVKPLDESYDSFTKGEKELIPWLATSILNQRLERQMLKDGTAFTQASVDTNELPTAGKVISLSISPKPGREKEAFEQAYSTLRQFELYGANAPELDRILRDLESQFAAAEGSKSTRNTGTVVAQMLHSVENNSVVTNPAQDHARFEAEKPDLTLDAVNAAAKALFNGDAPLLWHSAEDLHGFDKAELLASYNKVHDAKYAAADVITNKPWPYTDFPGEAATVVKRETIPGTDATLLTYSSGLKAIIKTARYTKDSVSVTVRYDGGIDTMSPATNPPVFAAQTARLTSGGLGKLDTIEVGDALTGKSINTGYGIGDSGSGLEGGSTIGDFPTMMQLLMAYTVDPGFRPQPFELTKASYHQTYPLTIAYPQSVLGMHEQYFLHGNDPRWKTPTPDELDKISMDQVKTLTTRLMTNSPVEVSIVGDISEADAEAQINKTFAKLPPHPTKADIPADAVDIHFPTSDLVQTFKHDGRADQTVTFIAWPTTDLFANPQESTTLKLLSDIIQLRMIDQVREDKAMSYSPHANDIQSEIFKGYGYISATAEVRPEHVKDFYDIVGAIAEDLKAHPVSDDEMVRARKPELDKLHDNDKSNFYWQLVLAGYSFDQRPYNYMINRKTRFEKVTAADIQAAAQKYLIDAKAAKLTVLPSDKAKPEGN